MSLDNWTDQNVLDRGGDADTSSGSDTDSNHESNNGLVRTTYRKSQGGFA